MHKLIGRVTALILPARQAQATPVRGKCIAGCGTDGKLNVWTSMPGGKPPCC